MSGNSFTLRLIEEHRDVTRRQFLKLGAAGVSALSASGLLADEQTESSELAEAVAALEYLTPQADFGTVERGNPLPYTLPPEKLAAAGLTRETWKLEVVADPESNSVVENPLSRETGNALDFDGLMKLAERHAVRFPKVMTCNNGNAPLGMGLWEGVPLREVIWLARPESNIRRVFYHGYHNDDPQQLFQSSLPIGRVLEEPPGMPPVVLCYKLNGRPLSGKRGGPVRLIAPEAYGFKSVKWLNRVVLTNLFHANDTYARGNNDVDSWLKTFARMLSLPKNPAPMQPLAVTGVAQVGISGLKKVQVWVTSKETTLPADDPYFTSGDWRDVEILSPPQDWGGDLPDGALPQPASGFDPQTGRPHTWPMRYAIAHWAGLLPGLPAGKYDIRCRTIDEKGLAQPLPRPFRKSGRNAIERRTLIVKA